VTETATPTTPPSGPGAAPPDDPDERRRDRRTLTLLVGTVVAILLFTAVSVVIEISRNYGARYRADVVVGEQIRPGAYTVTFKIANTGTRPGRPDVCDAVLFDLRGSRAGVASVRLRSAIEPGSVHEVEAVAPAARPIVNGAVTCRSLSPQ
jgi:hypothetical protein